MDFGFRRHRRTKKESAIMALIDQYALANDAAFAARVAMALINALNAIETEPTTTVNHAANLAWVKGIRQNPGNIVRQLCLAAAADATVLAAYIAITPHTSTNITDSAIQTVVTTLVTSAEGV